MAVVAIDRLSKRYDGGGELAVKEVSLTVADGEFMVLLGPSGCGKSSVLRMIAGLEPITVGHGVDRRPSRSISVPAKDRDIAMVFQSYALYPHMDVCGEPGVRAAPARRRRATRSTAGSRGAADKLGLTPFLAAQAARALRRPAPARGARPRHRARSQGVPVRRAALEPRRRAARHHPQRADPAAEGARHHHDLRHPRPDRGDDHGRPDLHHEPGRGGADRQRRSRSIAIRPTPSSRASSATRR